MSDRDQMSLLPPETDPRQARSLPRPAGSRFQPLRAGILNIWQYDDQELHFHQGRLILRGENGTGKSKALEILLPFLLDASLQPRRLDPFQGGGRSMRWNLLEEGKYDHRTGYVWLELGRRSGDTAEDTAEEGRDQFLTLGCGLHASQRSDEVKAWYFLTSRRIGEAEDGLSLTLPGPTPRTLDQLRRALEDDPGGQVFKQARDYREQVDRRLFGLGEERYKSLVHLLLQLRRPQLSEKLDPQRLSELLTHSLPPIDEDLVGRLSSTYERLDQEVKEIARLRQAIDAVSGFLEVYRDYCRGFARQRSLDLTSNESQYHKKAAQVREAVDKADTIESEITALSRRLEDTHDQIDKRRGEVRALEQSDAMRAAENLRARERETERLQQQAERDSSDHTSFEEELQRYRQQLEAVEAAARSHRETLGEIRRRTETEAVTVGLAALHGEAEHKLSADASGQQKTVRGAVFAAVDQRQRAVAELRELQHEQVEALTLFTRCEERRRETDEQVRAALERRHAADAAVEAEHERLMEGIRAWVETLEILTLEPDQLERLVAALDHPDTTTFSPLVAELAAPRRNGTIARRASLETRLERLGEEIQAVEAQRDTLAQTTDPGPDPLPTRTAPRQDRAGAPFYRLFDFAPAIDTNRRAGIEAALQAAGLLDAWVMPDGCLLDKETLDTVLVPTTFPVEVPGTSTGKAESAEMPLVGVPLVGVPGTSTGKAESETIGVPGTSAGGTSAGEAESAEMPLVGVPGTPTGKAESAEMPTLASVLVFDPTGTDVAEPVLRALLDSIILGEPAATDPGLPGATASAWIDDSGAFGLGPVRGRWSKPAPEYLGAAAREATRRRRLGELESTLAGLSDQRDEITDALHLVVQELDRLDEEIRSIPLPNRLERLRHVREAAAGDLTRRRSELTEAEEAVAIARRERDAIHQRVETRARELELATWSENLDTFGQHLHRYQASFSELVQQHLRRESQETDAARTRQNLDQAEIRRDQAKRRALESRSTARSTAAELEALRATVGDEARDIVEKHRLAIAILQEHESLADKLRQSREERRIVAGKLDTTRSFLETELAELEEQRQSAVARLQRLDELGLLALAAGTSTTPQAGSSPANSADSAGGETPEPGHPTAWTLSHALQVARAVARGASDIDLSEDAMNRRSRRMNQRFQELSGEISGDFQPALDPEGELQVLQVFHQQRGYDGPSLLDLLHHEAEEHRRLLAEEEHELLRSFLLGEVGHHLRERLREAASLIDRINQLLETCRTASGMTLRLSWKADPVADPAIRQVVRLLRQDPEMLGDQDRRRLEDFFQNRIDEAREEHAVVPWREHLLGALDYRLWHRFAILRRMPGESTWGELTQKGHAASSGGEKAVALHLPLFAAAKAHYDSAIPEAPHLILLDEAFAGIDTGMRGRCMGLLVEFDLDFMMTSYDEWGCYAELPGVATYQLYRDPTLGGVEAIRFLWNGEELSEEESD